MSKALVYYHANCDDGFGAALAARMRLGEDTSYVPMRYDQRPTIDECRNAIVYMLDLTFPLDVMLEVQRVSARLIVLDHHKTAEATCAQIKGRTADHIHFDMKKSGAMLAWEYFTPYNTHAQPTIPRFFHYLQDQDLWTHRLAHIHEFVRNLRSLPMNFSVWEDLVRRCEDEVFFYEFCKEGRAQERLYRKFVADITEKCKRPVLINGHKGLQCNAPWNYASDVGHELANESKTFGFTWFVTAENTIVCSLRSNGDYDVSTLAKCFGGGGHKNAAGFTLDLTCLKMLADGNLLDRFEIPLFLRKGNE